MRQSHSSVFFSGPTKQFIKRQATKGLTAYFGQNVTLFSICWQRTSEDIHYPPKNIGTVVNISVFILIIIVNSFSLKTPNRKFSGHSCVNVVFKSPQAKPQLIAVFETNPVSWKWKLKCWSLASYWSFKVKLTGKAVELASPSQYLLEGGRGGGGANIYNYKVLFFLIQFAMMGDKGHSVIQKLHWYFWLKSAQIIVEVEV